MSQTENMTAVEQTGKDTVRHTGAERLEKGPVLSPAVDIFENDEQVLLLADLPGVEPDGLDVEVDEDRLTLEARRPWKTRNGEEVVVTYRRSFVLSPHIDAQHVAAKLEHGVLRLELPKHAAVRRRRIAVKG
jgi:HSP20 family molecular chaperone IbpA